MAVRRGLLMLVLIIFLVGCGGVESQPGTTRPTPPLEVSPTSLPTLGIGRQTLEHTFEGIGFPSFMGHGAAELVSSSLPNRMGALFIVEIYGPAQDVEAVEMWMPLSTDMSVGSAALLTLLDIVSPDWAERDSWLDRAIGDLEQQDEVVERHGDRLYTLRSVAFPKSLFFSVEGVQEEGAPSSQ